MIFEAQPFEKEMLESVYFYTGFFRCPRCGRRSWPETHRVMVCEKEKVRVVIERDKAVEVARRDGLKIGDRFVKREARRYADCLLNGHQNIFGTPLNFGGNRAMPELCKHCGGTFLNIGPDS